MDSGLSWNDGFIGYFQEKMYFAKVSIHQCSDLILIYYKKPKAV